MKQTHRLSEGWTLRMLRRSGAAPELADDVPATVPGCVHTDLLAAGVIADPYVGVNEVSVDWIGRQDWEYRCSFALDDLAADEVVELVAEGLDTVAGVTVNSAEVLRASNMHRTYVVDIGAAVRVGSNDLRVTFGSPYDYVATVSESLGRLPATYPTQFNAIRKMACNFGWDWGPALVTAGIWRPLLLQRWRTARLGRVTPRVRVEGRYGVALVEVEVVRAPDALGEQVDIAVQIGSVTATAVAEAGAASAVCEVVVPDVEVWWPHDLGNQPLYPVTVTLTGPDGAGLDSHETRIGFRNVRLDTSADARGSAFTLLVNDAPVFVRGVNWIPDDCFPSRVTHERYLERLRQAVSCNVNLVRVWGGGIYESREFYEVCDEIGLLVWQDFLFACAAYSESDPLRSEIEAEARDNVQRLSDHPSLVLWNGNNECIWGYHDWGWQEQLAGRDWGLGYYVDLLPGIVADVDGTRPYWPGSPYSGSEDVHPNDQAHGCTHVWDVWNERDYVHYRQHRPRFVSEFGFSGPANWATLEEYIQDRPLEPRSPGMVHHQRAADGEMKLDRGLEPRFERPATMADWHFATQLNQARAMTLGIEHFRSLKPYCMGSIVWQLNDCWPVSSWAAVDGAGRPKPAWYALRRSFAPQLLTIQPRSDGLAVVGVNDGSKPWRTPVTVERRDLEGRLLGTFTRRLIVGGLSASEIAIPATVAAAVDPASEVLVATAETGERSFWYFVEDKELRYPQPKTLTRTAAVDGQIRVQVEALTFIRDLALLVDRVDPDARVDTMLVTLLPGESHEFVVSPGRADAADARWTTAPAMRCANELVVRHER